MWYSEQKLIDSLPLELKEIKKRLSSLEGVFVTTIRPDTSLQEVSDMETDRICLTCSAKVQSKIGTTVEFSTTTGSGSTSSKCIFICDKCDKKMNVCQKVDDLLNALCSQV